MRALRLDGNRALSCAVCTCGDVQILNALSLAFENRQGQTNTQAALQLLYKSVFTAAGGDRQGVDNIGVVVTDGYSNVQADRTLTEAEAARQSGIEVYTVGLSDDVNPDELTGIASSSDHVIMIPDSYTAADIVLEELCG